MKGGVGGKNEVLLKMAFSYQQRSTRHKMGARKVEKGGILNQKNKFLMLTCKAL